MSQPLVTLVTPVYNQAEFLAATLESVLAQDYPALEYLVIDDGSSDESLAVARRYEAQHPGRLTVLTQANSGQAATLNRGWSMARGEILGYLSSDDCLVPGAVSRMVQALQARPGAPVAYCDFWLIDAQGRRLRETATEDFSAERLTVDLVCQPGPGAFFRRGVFERHGGWRADLRQVPDFEFWLRACGEGDFLRVPQTLAEYRIHEGSASFRVMPQARAEEIVRVIDAHYEQRRDAQASKARAQALSLAAKNHAQSGRLLAALGCFGRALRLRPALVFNLRIWRQLAVGIARRAYYRLRFTTGMQA